MLKKLAACLCMPLAMTAPAIGAQQAITVTGSVRHEQAQTSFPVRIGEFQRQSAFSYDPAGRDMSAEYRLSRGGQRLHISVYIYPAPPAARQGQRERSCRQSFDDSAAAIRSRFRGAEARGRGAPLALEGTEPSLRHQSVFTFRSAWMGVEQELRSELDLYCYVGGDWLVKYRVTGPATFPIGDAVESFIRTGPWPGRAMPDSVAALGAPEPRARLR